MKYGCYNWMKINYYEATIQDIEAQMPKNNPRRKRILKFIIKEYKRRIKFFKDLDKLERG